MKSFVVENAMYLWLFILGLFSAWAWQLLPYKAIRLFDTSRKFQLLLLYFIALFTLDIAKPDSTSVSKIFLQAGLTCVCYLVFTKQSINFFLASTGLLCLFVILETIIIPRLSEKKQKTIKKASIVVLFTMICTVGVGFTKYLVKQWKDHRHKDDNAFQFALKFLLEGSREQQKVTGKVISLTL